MSHRFDHAIVRPPGANFADGLTRADLGRPDHDLALGQYGAYCRALERCGLELVRLPVDPMHPDSTFVEDTAVLWAARGLLTRPGAPSRAGEVDAIAPALAMFFPKIGRIEAPGTLDGGDVCEGDGQAWIGLSERTNEEGARQLAAALARDGIAAQAIDIRGVGGILHLKSGLSWLGNGRVAVIAALASHPALARVERLVVEHDEEYAANCVRVNDRVLIAAGFHRFAAELTGLGYHPLPLEMSEFRAMDGGLSCLSLRFLRG